MTKCLKRAGKNVTRREKILEPAFRRNRLHNGGAKTICFPSEPIAD